MSELLVEIYNILVERDESAKEMQNKVNMEIERMLIPYKNELTEEKAYTMFYDIAYTADREGVLFGVKLMMRLFLML